MSSGLVSPLLDVIPAMLVVMNRHRQVLYVNGPGQAAMGGASAADYLGLRPGEAFDCIHAFESPEGCGSSAYCPQCGGNLAAEAAERGKGGTFECQILRRGLPETADFRLFTTRVEVGGETHTICVAIDISSEIRQRSLERIFFHDLLNATGNIDGLAWLLAQGGEHSEQERCRLLLSNACRRLADEIRVHRDIFEAERGELEIESEPVEPQEFLHAIVEHYRHHPVARTRQLRLVDPPAPPPPLRTDPPLLGRVLGNLIKNALEATRVGQTVEVTVRGRNDGRCVQFVIWNPEPIPAELQKRIFTRAFSTKGAGRGLGTYGAKLIAERYLGGSLEFVSNTDEGTTFFLSLPLIPPSMLPNATPPESPPVIAP